MLIAGGLLAVGVLAIIGVVLLSIERKATPEPETVATPSRATIPLQQMEEPERVYAPPTPLSSSETTGDESSSVFSAEETPSVPAENEQLYEVANQLQQLQRRIETLERHLEMQSIVPNSFNHYENQDEPVLRTVPVALHNDSHQ